MPCCPSNSTLLAAISPATWNTVGDESLFAKPERPETLPCTSPRKLPTNSVAYIALNTLSGCPIDLKLCESGNKAAETGFTDPVSGLIRLALPTISGPSISAWPPTYKFLAIPAPPLVTILPLLTPLLSVRLVTFNCVSVCIVPTTSNSFCGLGLLMPTFSVLSTVITVVVVPALFILICKLEPLISCCKTPAVPSICSFSSLLIPTLTPATFLILSGAFAIFSASLRITFAAVITGCPGINKFNDFSDIPLNCGMPSPSILLDERLMPGRIPSIKPSIAAFGVNASPDTTATGFPFTSTNITL